MKAADFEQGRAAMHRWKRFTKRLTEAYVYPEICKYQDAIADPREYTSFLSREAPPPSGFMFYVHVPYCETLCHFCNYHKVAIKRGGYEERRQLFARYVVEIEWLAQAPYLASRVVRAVQFGGGTPSAVEPEFIAQVLDAIRRNFTCKLEMVTMEGTVTSLSTESKLRALKDIGIERLSFGVQTLNESIRKKLHVTATLGDIFKAVEAINRVGFRDYSHDLMFNLPGQTYEDLERDIVTIDREVRPTYVDCYNLNVMPNTMFSEAVAREDGDCPSDEKEVGMIRRIVELTRELGYHQVTSNVFSKTKEEGVLTLKMQLDGSETVGIGPSARGFVCGRGYRNVPDIKDYIERVDGYRLGVLAGNVATADEQNERQLVMIGNLRTVDKANVRDIEQFREQVDFLVDEGYAEEDEQRIRLTDEGFLWPGNVSELFFSPKQKKRRMNTMLSVLKNKENPYNQDHLGVSAKLYRTRLAAGR
jgi:oxygen-independent coproporphyrinogen III oxidase